MNKEINSSAALRRLLFEPEMYNISGILKFGVEKKISNHAYSCNKDGMGERVCVLTVTRGDDVLGDVVRQARQEFNRVLLASGDSPLLKNAIQVESPPVSMGDYMWGGLDKADEVYLSTEPPKFFPEIIGYIPGKVAIGIPKIEVSVDPFSGVAFTMYYSIGIVPHPVYVWNNSCR